MTDQEREASGASPPASVRTAPIQRSYVPTRLSYEDAAKAFEASVGHMDEAVAHALMARRAPWAEVEAAIGKMAGPSGLMIVGLANQGAITSLEGDPIRCRLYLVGNPVIAQSILRVDVRACLYVPFRVTLSQGTGDAGATFSFDRPSSFLAALDNPALLPIGQALDKKIDDVMTAIAAR
jgi:uncharacterized protein (DUF302 family)